MANYFSFLELNVHIFKPTSQFRLLVCVNRVGHVELSLWGILILILLQINELKMMIKALLNTYKSPNTMISLNKIWLEQSSHALYKKIDLEKTLNTGKYPSYEAGEFNEIWCKRKAINNKWKVLVSKRKDLVLVDCSGAAPCLSSFKDFLHSKQ